MEYIDATYNVVGDVQLHNLKKEYQGKLQTLTEVESSQRPGEIDIFGNAIYGMDTNMYTGFRGNNLYELYWLWVLSDVTTTISNVLTRKVFRGGLKKTPLTSEPSEEEYKKIKSFTKKCNSDNQSYKDVLKEIYDDLNWADVGIQLNLKDYFINSNKEIVGGQIREVMRVNPINVKEIKDQKTFELGFLNGEQVFVDIKDRSTKTFEAFNKRTGLPNIPAHYIIRTQTGEKYYNSSELIIKHKFKQKSGFSPLHSTKNKILTLMEMDYYVRKEYSEGKPSKKMLAFKTQNRQNMIEAYKDYKEKISQNPNGLYPLIIQSSPENRQPLAEVIDFMKPLSEMEFSEMRARYITDIGALWGTSPMFHNDMSTGGGLNNEGLQMTVTNEVVEDDKSLMEENFIEETFNQLGLNISYRVSLHPNREEDLVAKEDLFHKQIENARNFIELGGVVQYNEGQFIFNEETFTQEDLSQTNTGGFGEFAKNQEVTPEQEVHQMMLAVEKEAMTLEVKPNE